MALEAAFDELYAGLHRLRDDLLGLRVTVVEDRPLTGDVLLTEQLGDAIDELLGKLEEGVMAGAQAQHAAGHPVDIESARRALTTCQQQFNRMARQFTRDLLSYERITQLRRLGRRRGGEWRAWADSVSEALEECQQPFDQVTELLFRCWQEITERIGIAPVSVRATNIGQQITIPEDRQARQEAFG